MSIPCERCQGTGYRRVFLRRKAQANGILTEHEISYEEWIRIASRVA